MATDTTTSPAETSQDLRTRFHLSLNVADLPRSVEFFGRFFGIPPAKSRTDYAKFELNEPPVTLSLEPTRPSGSGSLNHVGIRLPDRPALIDFQSRLESVGIATNREDGVECCYARQTKFWVHDPDGNLWEIYTLEEDLEHRGAGQAPEAVLNPAGKTPTGASTANGTAPAPAPAVWQHRLGEPLPPELFIHDQTVDEVQLQGTFNMPLAKAGGRRS